MNSATQRHRAEQLLLRRATVAQLETLFPSLEWERLDESFPAFAVKVAALVRRNRDTSTGLAIRYLRAVRVASSLPGEFSPARAAGIDPLRLTSSLRATSVVPLKRAAAAGRPSGDALAAARTMTGAAVSRMVLDAGRETVMRTAVADPASKGWRRVLGADGCAFCRMLADRGAVYDEATVDFASHDGCVLPRAVVTSGTVDARYRRWYQGEVVVLRTSTGDELSITPNHPVLTDRGWVEAGLLHEGDDVVQRAGADLASLHVPHENDVPTRIEDAWRAHCMDGLARVPAAAEDFHGDGRGTEGDVEVVAADGLLPDVFYTERRQMVTEPVGAGTGAATVTGQLSASSAGRHGFLPADAATVGGVSGLSSGEPLVGGGLCEGHRGSLLASAALDSFFDEPSLDDASTHALLFGEALLGFAVDVPLAKTVWARYAIPGWVAVGTARYDPPPMQDESQRASVHASLGSRLRERLAGGIQLNRVQDLRRIDYSGHVYNLRTQEGWFAANSVIVSNCGCIAAPDYGDTSRQVSDYAKSTRNVSDADRARVRAWMRANPLAG